MAKKNKNTVLDSADATAGQLERLARLIRSACHVSGLHPAQWEALRYLARANQFSNSPGAVAKYLGATKGTVSQTVLSLVKKGLLGKSVRNDDSRSVALILTEQGQKLLIDDPLLHLEKSIADLSDKTRKRFTKGVAEILAAEHVRQNEPSFGTCSSCRFYRGGDDDDTGRCMAFNCDLNKAQMKLLCVEHVSAS